jgi:exo-beta-1,3-glucanase (GH17 family)
MATKLTAKAVECYLLSSSTAYWDADTQQNVTSQMVLEYLKELEAKVVKLAVLLAERL